MITRKPFEIATAVLISAVALGGCGSKKNDNVGSVAPAATTVVATTVPPSTPSSPASTPTKAATTAPGGSPRAKWAHQLCTELASAVKPLNAPNMQSPDPAATKVALVNFFDQIIANLGVQHDTLVKIGPPPGGKGKGDFQGVVTQLVTVRSQVTKVTKNLKATSPSNKAELAKVVQNLGTQMKSLSSFQGPVASLENSAKLAPLLKADPACQPNG